MKVTGTPVLYRDRWIECTTEALIIHFYYFPLGNKTIPYGRIRSVREITMGPASGQWRIWGFGNLEHWYGLDPGRTRKTRGFVLDLGRYIKPVITPDDPDQVSAIIKARMKAV